MMSGAVSPCPLCGARERRPLFAVSGVPVHPFRPPAASGLAAGFGDLDIVACGNCGHVRNAAFDPARVDDLYAANVLTNAPVSGAMVDALEKTADFILRRAPASPAVVDVGGGTGALARCLARRAGTVHLVEPSRALDPAAFAGTGVTLHRAIFPAPSLPRVPFDVVVARQVLEHVPDPRAFLRAIRARLAPGGVAYVETPCFEYIRDARSIVDFHYPHVQYFDLANQLKLFATAGLRAEEIVDLKDGHDRGFLLAPAPIAEPDFAVPGAAAPDPAAFARARAAGAARLEALRGRPLALYGANAYSQALLGLYPDALRGLRAVFDDTPAYAGQTAYADGIEAPIRRPDAANVNGLAAIVVSAYLHDAGIAGKLRALGFAGEILTVRSDAGAGAGATPASLFAAEVAAGGKKG